MTPPSLPPVVPAPRLAVTLKLRSFANGLVESHPQRGRKLIRR